ncbi:MAG: TauD/TfdA dioxygenase family protein [Gammaproteobacteria bacterium]
MPMSVTPTSATLGATVTGVRLAALGDHEWEEIHRAFLAYGVLFFPGQHLQAAEQLAFARRFGEIEILVPGLTTIPISNKDEHGNFHTADSHRMKLLRGNEGWHTDSSYMPLAAKASVLSAHVLPREGGGTAWADARAAYDALDEGLRRRLDGLNAYHSYFYSQRKIGHEVAVGAGYGFFEGEPPLRPIVKVHPETGRRCVFLGRHAGAIPGMDDAEADLLIAELNAFICQPPRVVTHRWQPGDVAVWDNRCLLHRALPYDYGEERVLMHTRIRGEATERALNA